MKADDIFFEKDGEKKLVATLGYTSKPFIGIKKTGNLEHLRLISPDSKNALPLRVKMNGTIFALGSFPDGIVAKAVYGSNNATTDEYNKSYVYDLTNNKLNLIATLDFNVSNGYFFKEQNFYLLIGDYLKKSGGAYTHMYTVAMSFDGYNWSDYNFTKVYDCISDNGRVAFLIKESKPNFYGTYDNYYSIYSVEDDELVLVKTTSNYNIFNTSLGTYEEFDFSGNLYFKKSSSVWYMLTKEDEEKIIDSSDVPRYSDPMNNADSGNKNLYYSRTQGKIFTISIDKNKKISITNSNGEEENSVIAEGSNGDGHLTITVMSAKEIFSGITDGSYTIENLFSQLSNYIAENSYRVLASGFTITDGNFTISMEAGQRIWLCSEGESPNYAKAIRFVDGDGDYSGSTPDYVAGTQNYNFYGDGSTGFAKVYKAKGRYGSYMDVSSYNVTVTGGISFL